MRMEVNQTTIRRTKPPFNNLFFVGSIERLSALEKWLVKRSYSIVIDVGTDKSGNLMVGLKEPNAREDQQRRGLIVCKTGELFDLAYEIARKYEKGSC